MGTVRSLRSNQGLEEFCDFLYGKEQGYVHAPIKNPETGEYSYHHFFEWPSQRDELLAHVEASSPTREVFITPGMFSKKTSLVQDSQGSYVVWADFDGNVPTLEELKKAEIPKPTLCVQSSEVGREHWYWKFEQFNTNVAQIQSINRAIAYALKADVGAWDAGHSLRPVGTINHKNGQLPVHVIRSNNVRYFTENFSKVPLPTDSYNLEQFRKENIPNALKTLLKHGPWKEESVQLINEYQIPVGQRSGAIAKLCYLLCEQGLDNSEVYSVLFWVDKRWKKFYDRHNREKYYVSLINYARQKVPYEGIKGVETLAEKLVVRSWKEVTSYDQPIKWLIDGILPHRGVLYLVGPSGVGKSTLAVNICANLALGRGTPLGNNSVEWAPVESKPLKVIYISLEMFTEEVQEFFLEIEKGFTEEELKIIDQNFFVYSESEPVKFYKNNATLSKFIATLQEIKPDVILIDSASRAVASNISDQEEVISALERMETVRDKLNTSMIVIHHPRKDPPSHGYKEAQMDDMFGSAYLAASASSIVSMQKDKQYEENKLLQIKYLKARFKGSNVGFSVKMTENRNFVKPTMGAIATPKPKGSNDSSKSKKSYFDL